MIINLLSIKHKCFYALSPCGSLLCLMILIPVIVLSFVILRIVVWEFKVGSLSNLTQTYAKTFENVLTVNLRKEYDEPAMLLPYSRLKAVYEYTDECSVVYAVNVFPHSSESKDDVLFNDFYKLVKIEGQWTIIAQEYDNTFEAITHLKCK